MKNIPWYWALVIIVVFLGLILGVFWIVTGYRQSSTPKTTTTSTAGSKTSASTTTSVVDTAGWKTYVNEKYKYQFLYPPEASITEAKAAEFHMTPEQYNAGVTFEDLYNQYTGKICIHLEYKDSYILISASENYQFEHIVCGRTGMGTEGTEFKETVTVAGKKYQASGVKEITAEYQNVSIMVDLEDKTRIEFGGSYPGFDTQRPIIHAILNSYKIIE